MSSLDTVGFMLTHGVCNSLVFWLTPGSAKNNSSRESERQRQRERERKKDIEELKVNAAVGSSVVLGSIPFSLNPWVLGR